VTIADGAAFAADANATSTAPAKALTTRISFLLKKDFRANPKARPVPVKIMPFLSSN